MISKAVRDYFRSFSIKKLGLGTSFLWIFYALMWPLYYSGLTSGNVNFESRYYINYYINYYAGMISCLIGLGFMKVNPIQLPKLMFLSPLTGKQRLQYLKARFFIRTAFPLLLLFICRLVIWSRGFEPWDLVADLYVIFSIVGGSFVTINGVGAMDVPREKWEALQKEKAEALKGLEVKSVIAMVVGLVGWVFFIGWMENLSKGSLVPQNRTVLGVLLVVLLIQIVQTIRLFRYLPDIFSMACDYERTGKLL